MPGKNEKTNTKTRNANENPFNNKPKGLLNVNFAGKSGRLVTRRQKTRPIDAIYDEMIALKESDVMLFNAIVLPRFISDSMHDTTNDTTIEFMGTSQPGRMHANHLANGTP